jgi:hypothetical protein
MSVTVELPEDLLDELRAEAARRGVTLDAVITARLRQAPRRLAITAIGASDGEYHASDADEELRAKGFGQD